MDPLTIGIAALIVGGISWMGYALAHAAGGPAPHVAGPPPTQVNMIQGQPVGVIPTPPPLFPGFQGLSPADQNIPVGKQVDATFAFSKIGIEPFDGQPNSAHDAAVLKAIAHVVGKVVRKNPDGTFVITVTTTMNTSGLPLPTTIAKGKQIVVPSSAIVPSV